MNLSNDRRCRGRDSNAFTGKTSSIIFLVSNGIRHRNVRNIEGVGSSLILLKKRIKMWGFLNMARLLAVLVWTDLLSKLLVHYKWITISFSIISPKNLLRSVFRSAVLRSYRPFTIFLILLSFINFHLSSPAPYLSISALLLYFFDFSFRLSNFAIFFLFFS
jgi:hypothetical protein